MTKPIKPNTWAFFCAFRSIVLLRQQQYKNEYQLHDKLIKITTNKNTYKHRERVAIRRFLHHKLRMMKLLVYMFNDAIECRNNPNKFDFGVGGAIAPTVFSIIEHNKERAPYIYADTFGILDILMELVDVMKKEYGDEFANFKRISMIEKAAIQSLTGKFPKYFEEEIDWS